MGIRDNTKYAFANAIKALLPTKNLQKIRVTELCEMCGAERPTFYYHFRDKYDLIAWIYLKDLEQSVKDNGGIYNQRQTTLQMYRMLDQKPFTVRFLQSSLKMHCLITSSSTISEA